MLFSVIVISTKCCQMIVAAESIYCLYKVQLFLLVILNQFAKAMSVCPLVCHQIACTTGVLSCPDGGLSQIPVFLPPGTSKILLTNHRFINPYLKYSNLSNYGPPQFKVIKITIQNCGLVGISGNTFSHLTDLSILDLANNRIEEIVPDTFTSLTLKFLRLDGNKDIVLHIHSFRGLILTTLSLIDCALTHLPFETINEVSGSLKKLYLTNNNIKTFDRQFKDIFEQLTVFQINDNPINCTCDLQWLGSVLLWRRKHYVSADISGVSTDALCHSPSNNVNKPLVSLSLKDFNCLLPQLKLVDVYMTSNISARLTCSSESDNTDGPTVRWWSRASSSSTALVQESQARQSAALSVISRSKIDHFLCVISNLNGNITVLVKIQWPGLSQNSTTSLRRTEDIVKVITLIPSMNSNSSSTSADLYSKRFTLLEMIGGVVGTFTLTLILFLCIYRYLVVAIGRERKKKWYVSYEATGVSDSQTYDVPHCTMGAYYSGQLFTNHNTPIRYGQLNGHSSLSAIKPVAL